MNNCVFFLCTITTTLLSVHCMMSVKTPPDLLKLCRVGKLFSLFELDVSFVLLAYAVLCGMELIIFCC